MKTVKEVSQATGISIRTLHHYDAIGLLKPTRVTQTGYRLYDADALERLYMILVYRQLGLPLKTISRILDAPDYDRNQVLEHQIKLMKERITVLQDQIDLAQGTITSGGKYMSFDHFDPQKMNEHSHQAKILYGKTDAYREYEQKSKDRTQKQESELGTQVMDFFVRLGKMRPCEPDCEKAQAWARELQAFFTAHYYTCTPQILKGLAESYAGGGSMTENIDKAGGDGTGAFAKEVIDAYLRQL